MPTAAASGKMIGMSTDIRPNRVERPAAPTHIPRDRFAWLIHDSAKDGARVLPPDPYAGMSRKHRIAARRRALRTASLDCAAITVGK